MFFASTSEVYGKNPKLVWNEEDDLMLGEYLMRNYRLGIKATSTLRNGVLMAARSASE